MVVMFDVIKIWKKCCDRRTLFMYVRHVHPSQQDSCGAVPPKNILSELNYFMGLLVTYGATFNYFDLFGVL